MFSCCCRNGFFLTNKERGREVLGSVIGYGPLGTALRNNFINEWQYSIIGTSSANVHPIHFNVTEEAEEKVESVDHMSHFMKPPYGLAFYSRSNSPLQSTLSQLGGQEHLHIRYVCPFKTKQDWMIFWQRRKLKWWKQFSRCPENFVLQNNDDSTSAIKYCNGEEDIVIEDIQTYDHNNNKDNVIYHFRTNIHAGLWSILTDSFLDNNRQWNEHQTVNALLQLNRRLAPVKLVFLPQENSPDQQLFCDKLVQELNLVNITATCHKEGPLESRLAYHDEIGTPSRVLLDDNTLTNGVIYLQDRDSGLSEPLESELLLYTLQRMYQRYKSV